jgi:hypothetical protein
MVNMPTVVGIDEAGYGPTLGPLVLGASVWEVGSEAAASDLWEPLSDCVTQRGTRGDWRLIIADSKKAFDRARGVGTLERSVRALAATAGLPTDTLAALLRALGADAHVTASPLPWYQALATALPLAPHFAASPELLQRLRGLQDAAGVRCRALHAEVVPEDRFNTRVAQTRNKASVLLEPVLRLIERATRGVGGDCRVHVDRLGGRRRYDDVLRAAFPERRLHVLREEPEHSAYALTDGPSTWQLSFEVAADSRHLPVALASMVAKYLREALMAAFNAFWSRDLPTLQPTAGYYTDAQRFLASIAPLLPQLGLPAEQFVRAR